MALASALPLGTPAPAFRLPDTNASGKPVALEDFASAPALLVAFLCNHCPYVKHLKPALAAFAREYQPKGLAMVGISSNDPASHPDDAPAKMSEDAARFGYTFPYLFDETQDVARAYHAACTPEFYLFDGPRRLVYHGQFDSTRPGGGTPTGADLRAAVEAVLARRAPSADQKPSVGCSIKWKRG